MERPYIGVIAATNDLETVFVTQSLIRTGTAGTHVWSTAKKSLRPLGFDLDEGGYLGGQARGCLLAFRESRHPVGIVITDGKTRREVTVKGNADFSYSAWLFWGGDDLWLCAKTPKRGYDGPPGREFHLVLPSQKRVGVVPSLMKTLRTGSGKVEESECSPLACGSPGDAGKTLILFRGGQVAAWNPQEPGRVQPLYEVPISEVPDAWKLPVGVDHAENRVYAAWLDVGCDAQLDFASYLPALDALGEKRAVTLNLAAFAPSAAAGDAAKLRFDLTSLFDRMREKALKDYQEDRGPKSDSGVLTRQPWIRMLGGRDGKTYMFLNLRVWYGIRGADYMWPISVDTGRGTLQHAGDFHMRWGSGMYSLPLDLTWSFSPRGDALAVIDSNKLTLFLPGGDGSGGGSGSERD